MFKIFNRILKGIILLTIITFVSSSTGVSFLKTSNSNLNLTLDLTAMATKLENDIQNDLYSAKDTYSGYLTGYGADCPLCNGTLSCMPTLDVLHGNVYYTDDTYGEVRIVASSKKLSCGTIIRINESKISDEAIYAIVLDRGVSNYNIDLLSVNEEYASLYVGRSIISYDVLRRGWNNE